MANLIIATEYEARTIGGSTSSYTSNLCCTKSRAEDFYCNVSGSYATNLLVPYSTLSKKTTPNYLKFTTQASGTFTFTGSDIEYSTNDGANWTTLSNGTATPTLSSGTTVLWRKTHSGDGATGQFSSTCSFTVSGNSMSILYGSDFAGKTTLPGTRSLASLFDSCNLLTDASSLSLPATTLTDYCYSGMFNDCTALTLAPALSATTLAQGCYYYMFEDCSSLTSAPSLPATNLSVECYTDMFHGCTSLTSAPALPATTLTDYCYASMFEGCTSLTTTPSLPATTLASRCYSGMFAFCSSLTTVSALPATTLTQNCYLNMFINCTSLTTAPALPATTLASYCYSSMFNGCTGLTSVPSTLPATTLASRCYYYMFAGCSSLTTAPELPALNLVNYCYAGMFRNCTSLNYIKALFLTTPGSSYTSGWVEGVASSGTFVKNAEATWDVVGVDGVPTGWNVRTSDFYEYFSLLAENPEVYIYWESRNGNTLEYSVNNSSSWTTLTSGGDMCLLQAQKYRFRRKTGSSLTLNQYGLGHFYMLSISSSAVYNIKASGNIMSLLHGKDFLTANLVSLSGYNYAFKGLFEGMGRTLVLAHRLQLPVTELSVGCYERLFSDCTALTTFPALPATTLARRCYQSMFRECRSITSTPALPATTLASWCYENMFYHCVALTSAPTLPATIMQESCYAYMFKACTSLVTPPSLPATTLARSCYAEMFRYCSNLTSAPSLTASILADGCYLRMFSGCTKLNLTSVSCTNVNVTTGCSYNYDNEALKYVLKGNEVNNGIVLLRLTVTCTISKTLTLTIEPYSEASYDFCCIGTVNGTSLSSTANYSVRASGTTQVTTTLTFPSGTSTLLIGYFKDGSVNSNGDYAIIRMAPY